MAEYCPCGEIQKLEEELRNLTMQNSDIEAYIYRFSELALSYVGRITSEDKKIEHFIWRLTPPIQGNVIAAKPETYDSAKRLAQKLYDHGNKKGSKTTEIDVKKDGGNKNNMGNKRKGGKTSGSSKKPQTVVVHAASTQATPAPTAPTKTAPTLTNPYAETLPKRSKCNYHHNGTCHDMQCTNCKSKGNTARYCRSQPQ